VREKYMVVVTRHSSVPVGPSSFCTLFTGETVSGKEFFIPVLLEGDEGRMIHESINGKLMNPMANGVAVLLGAMEQVEQTPVFIHLDYDVNKACFRTHFATYYHSEVASKFYRSEVPVSFGILIPLMSADQIQVVVGKRAVAAVGRDINELESYINRSK